MSRYSSASSLLNEMSLIAKATLYLDRLSHMTSFREEVNIFLNKIILFQIRRIHGKVFKHKIIQ
jgi:hypothetical protein